MFEFKIEVEYVLKSFCGNKSQKCTVLVVVRY